MNYYLHPDDKKYLFIRKSDLPYLQYRHSTFIILSWSKGSDLHLQYWWLFLSWRQQPDMIYQTNGSSTNHQELHVLLPEILVWKSNYTILFHFIKATFRENLLPLSVLLPTGLQINILYKIQCWGCKVKSSEHLRAVTNRDTGITKHIHVGKKVTKWIRITKRWLTVNARKRKEMIHSINDNKLHLIA